MKSTLHLATNLAQRLACCEESRWCPRLRCAVQRARNGNNKGFWGCWAWTAAVIGLLHCACSKEDPHSSRQLVSSTSDNNALGIIEKAHREVLVYHLSRYAPNTNRNFAIAYSLDDEKGGRFQAMDEALHLMDETLLMETVDAAGLDRSQVVPGDAIDASRYFEHIAGPDSPWVGFRDARTGRKITVVYVADIVLESSVSCLWRIHASSGPLGTSWYWYRMTHNEDDGISILELSDRGGFD